MSYYGGNSTTRGVVYPGLESVVNLAIQFSLDRYWVIGTDVHYVHQNKSRFSGKKGNARKVGLPSSEQWSVAPCLEYSWNENLSVSAGSWFTVGGRNSLNFLSMAGTVFYYF